MDEGDIIVEKPSFKKVVGLKDNYPNSFSRIDQVKQLLDFFIGGRNKGNLDRLLVLHGPPGVGKVDTVAKAIWYAKEHESVISSVRDGAYLIDLSHADNMTDICKAIIGQLNIDCID